MYRWLKRFIGLCVVGCLLVLIAWGSGKLYQTLYRGDPHHVVMPEGTAGVKPGSSVYYEGMVVGEVTDTRTLLHSDAETRQRANSAYLRKHVLLDEIEGLTPRKRNPYRKALVRFLLRKPPIPIGSSTYATGSAFYVTGQGYITLKNRGLTARDSAEPVYVPSNVKYPWLEQYVNMALSVAPFLDQISSFHTRLQNWYDASQSRGQQTDTTSGKAMIDGIPDSIDALQSKSDALYNGMDTLGTTIGNWNRNMESTLRKLPGSKIKYPGGEHSETVRLIQEMNDVGELSGPSSKASIRSFEHSLDGLNRSLQSVNEALGSADSAFLRNGILD